MTDRTDHRAEAEGLLAYAYETTEQASELPALVYAAVHALLAIHDALTAADRYAANEERQREAMQEATGDDLTAPEGENGSVEGEGVDDASEAILCPECGDHINTHNVEGCRFILCDCPRTPEDVARALIADAVKAERGGRRG